LTLVYSCRSVVVLLSRFETESVFYISILNVAVQQTLEGARESAVNVLFIAKTTKFPTSVRFSRTMYVLCSSSTSRTIGPLRIANEYKIITH